MISSLISYCHLTACIDSRAVKVVDNNYPRDIFLAAITMLK